jgi:hypothetical protein
MPVPGWWEGRDGQPEGYCHRQLVDAVRYLLAGGITWRAMPADFPSWDRVYAFFWRRRGQRPGRRVPRPGPRGCGPGSEAGSERHRRAVEQAERTEEAVGVQQEEAAARIVICDVSKGALPPRAESRDGRFGVARASARENYRQRRLPSTGEEAQLGGGVVDGVQAGGGTEFLPMSLRRLKISSGAVRGGRACAPSGAAVPWWLPRTARAPSRRR